MDADVFVGNAFLERSIAGSLDDNRSALLTDLKIPPQNRLEALKRDRKGKHSIRINDQWRICFVWTDGGLRNVEVVDYH